LLAHRTFKFSETRLAAFAIPILAQRRLPSAQVVANSGGEKPAVLCCPLLGEHHIIVRGASERVRIGLVGAGVPKLEETNRYVSAQVVHIAGRNGSVVLRMDEATPLRLGLADKPPAKIMETLTPDHVHAVHSIEAGLLKMGVIEKNPPEIVGQNNVGIDVEPPAVILAAGESRI
jgi:hypothetical protein